VGAPDSGSLVKGGAKRKRPTGSAGFRSATKSELALDDLFPVISQLHAEWCTLLGCELSLSNWRYAAWRGALVEAGYTADQLRSAFPGVAADPWWRERPDPHFMLGGNPGKIERFFPKNLVAVAPDRFAQRPLTSDAFEF